MKKSQGRPGRLGAISSRICPAPIRPRSWVLKSSGPLLGPVRIRDWPLRDLIQSSDAAMATHALAAHRVTNITPLLGRITMVLPATKARCGRANLDGSISGSPA
jgi:hypothetical protein